MICFDKDWAYLVSKGHLFPWREAFVYPSKCNSQSFPFYFPDILRAEEGKMGKWKGDNRVAKVLPLIVDLCNIWFFYLHEIHVIDFPDKSFLLLFILRKPTKSLNILVAIYYFQLVFKVHAFSTLAHTLMFFIYIFTPKFFDVFLRIHSYCVRTGIV